MQLMWDFVPSRLILLADSLRLGALMAKLSFDKLFRHMRLGSLSIWRQFFYYLEIPSNAYWIFCSDNHNLVSPPASFFIVLEDASRTSMYYTSPHFKTQAPYQSFCLELDMKQVGS
jgi:hypothetical protein